jgi:hypothetical protein
VLAAPLAAPVPQPLRVQEMPADRGETVLQLRIQECDDLRVAL